MAKEGTNPGCSFGQVSREKIKGLDGTMTELKGWMIRLDEKMNEALKRPGWATLAIISILSSAVVGLLVTLARHWSKTGG